MSAGVLEAEEACVWRVPRRADSGQQGAGPGAADREHRDCLQRLRQEGGTRRGAGRARCAVTAPCGDADPALFSIGSSKLPKVFGLVADTEAWH